MELRNIHDAKSQLSHLIELVYAGEEVIICKAGKPMVRLVRYQENSIVRKPGAWRHKVIIANDFDDESPEIQKLFEGSKNHEIFD